MSILVLSSPEFADGEPIPGRFTCVGDGRSPPLQWAGAPIGTRSLALAMEDLDAGDEPVQHWVVWDIPASRLMLPEGVSGEDDPGGLVQGRNDFGDRGYRGPCPPITVRHRYRFRLAALNVERLELAPDTDARELWAAAQPHILAEAEVIGTFSR